MGSTDDEKRPLVTSQQMSSSHSSRRLSQPTLKYSGSDEKLETSYRLASRRHTTVRPSLVGSGTYTVSLSWSDICVTVKIPGKRSICGESIPATEKMILKHVDGVAAPGSLIAVMGASGSGKSTLLNVLTSRNTRDYTITGDIRLNGVEVGSNIKNVSAYVQQDDLFMHLLTVREQLQFRALLRMDRRFNTRERYQRVEEVIAELGLFSCADTRIGGASGSKKGISGGERKRLAFACEALTNPPIFFCDEPTSSLDSFMAQSIVQTMQRMARRGRTILCTIHQPSSEVFAMFNQFLLLSEGRVAFMGESSKALEFFESLNYPCPDNFNPADHYILTMAIVPGKEVECRKKTDAICNAFAESESAKQLKIEEDILQSREDDGENFTDMMMVSNVNQSRFDSSMSVKLVQLFWRGFVCQVRDPMLIATQILQGIIMAVIVGLVYLQLDITQKGVQDFNGALFLLLNNVTFSNLFPVLTSFPDQMAIVMREYGSGMYGLVIYFLTKIISELPLFLLSSLISGAISYWLIGLQDTFEAFAIACLVLVLMCAINSALGYCISIIAGTTTLALSVMSPVLVVSLLFGGLFLNDDSVPDYFIWLKKISFFKYSYEILMVNQWKNVDNIDCDYDVSAMANNSGLRCSFATGMDVLRYQNMDKDNEGKDFGILGGICAGFYLIALISLIIRGRRSKE